MADIELVIKIPKRVYNYIRKYEHIANSDVLDIKDAILNGTPLPKGHGDLIDKSELKVGPVFNEDGAQVGYTYITQYELDEANVIIDADKEESEE